MAKRKRPKQRGVGEGKNRAVGPDAERQGQRRHQREGGRALQLAEREFQIVPELVEPLSEAHLTISLSAKRRHRTFDPGNTPLTESSAERFTGIATGASS